MFEEPVTNQVTTIPGNGRQSARRSDIAIPPTCGDPIQCDAIGRNRNSAGLGGNWKPLELRLSFVSLMSDSGVPVEEIARLVGHTSTRITEVVYRRELRPVITTGAEVMDKIFSG